MAAVTSIPAPCGTGLSSDRPDEALSGHYLHLNTSWTLQVSNTATTAACYQCASLAPQDLVPAITAPGAWSSQGLVDARKLKAFSTDEMGTVSLGAQQDLSPMSACGLLWLVHMQLLICIGTIPQLMQIQSLTYMHACYGPCQDSLSELLCKLE